MNGIKKGAVLAGAGALLLGGSLALSSALPVSGAGQVQPARVRTSCNSTNPCQKFTNSGNGPGLKGISNGSAGSSLTGALEGRGNTVSGVFGFSTNAAGAYFENDNDGYFAMDAFCETSNCSPFNAANLANSTGFSVDSHGNGVFSGTVTATGYITDSRTGGGHVGSFSAQSTRATIEDTGTARLSNGEGAVRFDSALASVIDMHQGYQVFLTPDGETRGLYVAQKYEGGFRVREIEHGRSSIYFDYRVVAHQAGASEARLPALTIKRPPHDNPAHVPE